MHVAADALHLASEIVNLFLQPAQLVGLCLHPGQALPEISKLLGQVAKLDVPTISLHDLRHTHATLLLKAGVPVKVVSERLGHANVAFTMAIYQHVLPGMQAAAAATFSGLLGGDAIDWNDWVTDDTDAAPEPDTAGAGEESKASGEPEEEQS